MKIEITVNYVNSGKPALTLPQTIPDGFWLSGVFINEDGYCKLTFCDGGLR